jgi:hypothetical protein
VDAVEREGENGMTATAKEALKDDMAKTSDGLGTPEEAMAAGPVAPKNDAVGNSAAATLAANEAPGDAPSEADVDIDYTFLEYDPSDVVPHFERNGFDAAKIEELRQKFAFRWCSTDHRILDKRLYAGWTIFSPAIKRGDLILCQMPLGRHAAMKRNLDKKKTARYDAAMNRFEQDASKYKDTGISTFDDDRGPSIRR